ncbi:hypothetical protein H4219_002669 [Mycoemilia scoparia]|uniref:Uncharacterized protein n=1 Tax=Mycoemilia scoparia TaxID=417184 RepID=A0A9W8DUG9_9FUNG|nr:hypothetical protein H4219_002669 [Mycoemilia scoparia]
MTIGLGSTYVFACKLLAWTEAMFLYQEYHRREDIYAFSLPQLLEHNLTLVNTTDIKSQITSDILTQSLENLKGSDYVDDVVFMARQIHDGKYLWEKTYQDVYSPKTRSYTYTSNWGHASADGTVDGRYPKSTPMIGKTLDVTGLDGFRSSIKCYVTDCDDCDSPISSGDSDGPTSNKMGVTNLSFYNDNSGIQYQVFWGSSSKNDSDIGVADVDKTGMVEEASFYRKNGTKNGLNYSILSPGGIKVNCDYSVLNHNGQKNSKSLIVSDSKFFKHTPFADVTFNRASTTLDQSVLNSLLNEENILRNLTYNIHNSFRLMNDMLFRTYGYKSSASGQVTWAVKTNLLGYDHYVLILAALFMGMTVICYGYEFRYMLKKETLPYIGYTQDVDTRVSALALSGIPPSDEYEKLVSYAFGPGKEHMTEIYQEMEWHKKENAHRDQVLYRWNKGVFVPHYDGEPCEACMFNRPHDEIVSQDGGGDTLVSTQVASTAPQAHSFVNISENTASDVQINEDIQLPHNSEKSNDEPNQRDNNTARSSFTTISTNSLSENQVRDIEQGRAEDMIYSQSPIPSLHRVMTPSNIPPALLEFYNATHAQNSGGNSGSGNGHKRNPSLPQTPPTLQGAGGSSTRRDSDDNRSTRSQSFDESRQNNVPPRK